MTRVDKNENISKTIPDTEKTRPDMKSTFNFGFEQPIFNFFLIFGKLMIPTGEAPP